jgi:DNA-binding NarL/FixJ family response regulator
MFDDDGSVFDAVRAGAAGYLLKDAEQEDVLRSIRAVAAGDAVFGPGIATRVRTFFTTATPATLDSPFPQLTGREIEILDLIAAGENNASIARRLGIAVKTVRNSASNIFLKLHAADRADAIIRARDAGLGRDR